jgi:hypothetical protein
VLDALLKAIVNTYLCTSASAHDYLHFSLGQHLPIALAGEGREGGMAGSGLSLDRSR